MALKATITSEEHAALSETLQPEYIEQGDGFILDVTPVGGFALDDVSTLKRTLSKERADRKKAETSLSIYKNEDGDFLDADDARAAMTSLADGDGETEQRIADAVKARDTDLKTRHAREIETLTVDRDGVVKQMSKSMIGKGGAEAIAKAKGKHGILMPKLENESRVARNSEGVFVLEILDDSGNPRTGSGPDGNMTFNERLSELKADTDYGVAFEGSGGSGSGDRNNDNRDGNNQSGGVIRVTRSQAVNDPKVLEKVADGSAIYSD